MIETAALNQLILDAFMGKMTWFEAANVYPVQEFIDSFYRTRGAMQKLLSDLTDAQVAYASPNNPTWSLSETVTHLIYSQNFYYNQLLDITTVELPHIIEAAKGFGEGAKANKPAEELRNHLIDATLTISEAIELTNARHDPVAVSTNQFFGKVNYQTWILLMLAHEVDHVRQSIVMRRFARAAIPS